MANRYWVGGTATWNATDTTVWSTTSGGASGASVPTSADSVFFDQAGTYTVTFSGTINCLDFTVSAGTVTFGGTVAPNVYGSMTLLAGTTWSTTGIVGFRATTTGKTVTTNGVTLSGGVSFNGVGGEWTLGSALTSGSSTIISNGTLTTSASNYSLSSTAQQITVNGGTLTLNNSSVTTTALNLTSGTINANTSTITLTGTSPITAMTGTFNAGTSTVNCTNISGSTTFNTGSGSTFYNVTFTVASGSIIIGGTNTFSGTLTIPDASGTSVRSVTFGSGQTISTFSCNGLSTTARIYLRSDVVGTARTLTITTWSTIQNTDFSDITLTNAVSGTSLGDRKGNTNITFSTPKTVYMVASAWESGWASSSGGSGSAANFPLAQDTAVIDNNTPSLINNTLGTGEGWAIGTIDLSARSTALQFDLNRDLYVYANVIGSSSITYNPGTGDSYRFVGRTTQTLTSLTSPNIIIDSLGGTLTLGGNCTLASTLTTTLTTGTLNLNSYILSTGLFSGASTASGITFGTSYINVTGNNATVWSYADASAATFSGTPLVRLTYSGATGTRTVTHNTTGTTEADAVSFSATAGSDIVSLATSSGVKNLDFTGFSGTFTLAGAATIYGNLLFSTTQSTSNTNRLTFAGTSGTQTINTNGRTVTFPITLNAASGSYRLDSAVTISAAVAGAITLTNGTLDLNGYTATLSATATATFLTATGPKNLSFNGGTLAIAASGTTAFNNAAPTNFTTTAGTGTGSISLTSASAKTFVGGGSTFNCTLNQGGAGTLTITGSNTFGNITNTYSSTGATTITFTAGTTTTVAGFTASGASSRLLTINSATSGTRATIAYSGAGNISSGFLTVQDLAFTPHATDGTAPYRWYGGTTSINGGNNAGMLFTSTSSIAYLLASGSSWTVPTDWQNANNSIHLIGGGGGGAGGYVSGNNRAAGGGGGGGGYTKLTNQTLTPSASIAYAIGSAGGGGAAGANGTAGGTTSWNSGASTAGGGGGGTASISPTSAGGTARTGSTFNGGTGGAGSFGTVASTGYGAGGGGGAGGFNGAGGNGGNGFGSTTASSISGGGGGGNGGGANATNGAAAAGGDGGNNSLAVGGATSNGGTGTLGGGGGGNVNTGDGGSGGPGIDISNTVGGAGGKGGAATATTVAANAGLYGGGGSGGGVTTAGVNRAGGAGSQGMIFIIYTVPSSDSPSNFFNFFPI